ncbi:MAG: hypothetical protein VW338_03515 [Rhodospirillaceae bacterium]
MEHIILMAAAIILLGAFLQKPARLLAANIAEGTHRDGRQKRVDAVVSTRFLLAKAGSDVDHVDICGASDQPVGVMNDEAEAIEDFINVQWLNASEQSRKVVASEAITVEADIYAAASGKVQNEPTIAGTYWLIGKARLAAAADGDVIEAELHEPIKVVVVAAQSQDSLTDSTGGTADTTLAAISGSGADSDINNNFADLAAQLAKIKTDVAAFTHTTPAIVKRLT